MVPPREGHLPLGHLGPDHGLSSSPCPDTAGGGSSGAVPSMFWNASLPFLSPQTRSRRRCWLQATQGARAEPSETCRMRRVTFNPPQTLSSLSRVDMCGGKGVDIALRVPAHAAQLSTAQPLCLLREALSPHDLVCPHFTEEETEPWKAARWSWFPGLLTLGLWPASLLSEVSPPDGSTAPQPGRCV